MRVTVNFGTKAAASIIDLPTAKQNSNIDFNDQDALFTVFLNAIETEIENHIGAPVIERSSAVIQADVWGDLTFSIPVNEITEVSYISTDDIETLITDYDFFANELTLGGVKPSDFKRLKITCTAGYPEADIPSDIKNAALLMFSERETYRENRPLKLNYAAQSLLRAYKIY